MVARGKREDSWAQPQLEGPAVEEQDVEGRREPTDVEEQDVEGRREPTDVNGNSKPPPPPPHKPGYEYTDFRQLGVHGRAFNDTAPGQFYSRLPAAAKADVTDEVWQLSLMSTNQYVRFVTDAPSVHFTYTTQLPCKGLWHMPTSGACYLDLYGYDQAAGRWRHIGPIGPGFGGDAGGTPFYDLTGPKALPSAWTKKNTTYLLYLPVRNTLVDDSGTVGVPSGFYIAGTAAEQPAVGDAAPVLKGSKHQIVWYGTSIQQGGVASRAGNLYDAIISRRLSREVRIPPPVCVCHRSRFCPLHGAPRFADCATGSPHRC